MNDEEPESEREPEEDAQLTLPPELAAVPKAELESVLRAGFLFVVKRTKSKEFAENLVSTAYFKMATTRRWDPNKTKLIAHFLGVIRSLASHHYTSKAPERDEEAHEGFHREMSAAHSSSAEDAIVESDDAQERQAAAATLLEQLEARIANHPLAPKVLACKAKEMTPAEIARDLGVPVGDVYGAIKLIKHHLQKLREGDGVKEKSEPCPS